MTSGQAFAPHLVSLRSSSRNMRFADDHPEVIDAYLTTKLSCGPFRLALRSSVRSTLLLQSSWGHSEENQPGKWRLILELSSAPAQSVNDGITAELYSFHYIRVDDALRALVELGPDALIAKFNVVAAYRNIPIHPGEQSFLEYGGVV